MNRAGRYSVFFLRITIGWLFFYAGITKVINPDWSAAGYLSDPQMLKGFYAWLISPGMLGITNFLNEWGLTLIGLALILGIFVRWAGWLGAIMMVLYWFPILDFPYPNTHSFIVDEHIVYAVALIFLSVIKAGNYWGLDKFFKKFS